MYDENLDFSTVRRLARQSPEERLVGALGQSYIDYRELWHSVLAGSVETDFPIHLDLELQDWCNQECVMCPRNSDTHPEVPFQINTHMTPSLETLEQLVVQAGQAGCLSINFGAYSEPLLSQHLWHLITLAHASGFVDSRIITNGLLLARNLDNIFASEVRNVFVSIDAFSDATYQSIRGRGYDKVRKGVIALLEERERRQSLLPAIRVSFVEMDANEHEVEAFIAYWRERVDHVDVQARTDYSSPMSSEFSLETSEEKVWTCKSPWQRLAITADGQILPCCDFNGKNIPLAHVQDSTLEQAWNGKRINFVRSGLLLDSLDNCNACQRGKIGERLNWPDVGL